MGMVRAEQSERFNDHKVPRTTQYLHLAMQYNGDDNFMQPTGHNDWYNTQTNTAFKYPT
jgi:hypothetical protein